MLTEIPWIGKILGSVATVILFYLLGVVSRRLVGKVITDNVQRYRAQKRMSIIIALATIVVIATIWAETLGSLTTMIGLLSAGIALALKDPISSVVGWFHINGSKLFRIGDRIEIGGTKGDVIDISMLTTSLIEIENWVDGEQSTGRIVIIPNNRVFVHNLFNYTTAFPYIWTELKFTITFESNWKKAADIFEQVLNETVGELPREVERSLREAQGRFLIHYRNFDPIVYIKIVGSGVQLIGRFLIDVRRRRMAESSVFAKVLAKIDEQPDVNLAYTTYRIVNK
ncbi:mechanosensitive ion channel family protein [bacterium]|nr:MAG: mechanosensitive ion channel family protein [bacterium]